MIGTHYSEVVISCCVVCSHMHKQSITTSYLGSHFKLENLRISSDQIRPVSKQLSYTHM
jgi:hypothetical protein